VTDLADLNKKPGGSSQGFISPDLNHNDVVKSGYIVSVARDAASGVTEVSSAACVELTSRLVSSYFASAVPVKPGETGTLFFATDTRGTIYRSRMGVRFRIQFRLTPSLSSRRAEALRPAVVNRKVTSGNRSSRGADTQQILASVVHTARLRHLDIRTVLLGPLCARQPTPSCALASSQ